jgi:hypothetical protein
MDQEALEIFCKIAGKLATLKGEIAILPIPGQKYIQLREIINDCQELMAIKADVAPIRLISGEFIKNEKSNLSRC